jgi:hypothetical protein
LLVYYCKLLQMYLYLEPAAGSCYFILIKNVGLRNKKNIFTSYVQGDRNVTRSTPDTCSIRQKNPLKSENKKERSGKCWKCPPRSAMHALTPKGGRNSFCAARFLCHGNGSSYEALSIYLAQQNRQTLPLNSYRQVK